MQSLKTKVATQTTQFIHRKNQPPNKPSPPPLKSQSTQFLSKAQRFHYQHPKIPGPCDYDLSPKERHTSDYHIVRQNFNKQELAEHMWIVSKGRQLFETSNQWKINIGPGKYHKNKTKKRQKSDWGKDNRFKYQITQQKDDIGPGAYTLGQKMINNRKVAHSAFNSKSSKSHMEQIVKNKLKLYQSKPNPQYQFCNKSKEIKKEIKQRQEKRQIICKRRNVSGSPTFNKSDQKLPRLETDRIGPGSYNLDSPIAKPKKKKIKPDLRLSQSRQELLQCHTEGKVVSPGPGTYDLDKKPKQSPKLIKKPVLGVILKQTRFKQSSRSEKMMQSKRCLTIERTTSSNREDQMQRSHSNVNSIHNILRKIQQQKDINFKLLQQRTENQKFFEQSS